MHLADHIRPLLQDHDCVIIPDFGGLVAEPVPARLSAARLHLGPPAKQVAFNQALTRNDGLLVDALSQYLRIPATQAREVLRHAVEDLHQELRLGQRTELPGIGVFRQAPGRGLSFDYTGTDNLLPAAFGLPPLSVRPVLATDARLAREKRPALLLQAATRRRPPAARRGLTRLLQGVGAGVATGLLVLAGISFFPGPNAGSLPVAGPALAAPTAAPEPQQATLAHNDWSRAEQPTTAPTTEPTGPASESSNPDAADFDPAKVAARARTAPAPVAAATVAPTAPTAPAAAIAARKPALPLAARPAASALKSAKIAKAPVAKAPTAKWRAPATAPRPAASHPTPLAPREASLTLAAPAGAVAPKAAALTTATATTTKRRPDRSYVVAGAFLTRAGAEAYRRSLAAKGFTGAKVILPPFGSRYFRLSVADYATAPEARLAAAQLRAKFQRSDFYAY